MVKLATKQDAHVVNLGDGKQLGAVEAGKPFAQSQLKKYGLQTANMEQILRQKNLLLKQAVYAATKGDIAKAFESINKSVIEVQDKNGLDDPIARRELIAQTFLSMPEDERAATLVICPSNDNRNDTNNLIRKGLKQEGTLKNKSIKTTCLVNKNLTREAKTKSYNYYPEHIVRFNRGYTKLGVEKNEYLKVMALEHQKNLITLINQDNKIIEWDPKKIGSNAVELYTQKKRAINEGEVLFWRRAGVNDDGTKRHTNEKLKILSINKLTNSVKFVDISTGEISTMKLDDMKNKHFDYAYCLTAHQAQGQTSDKVIINLESWRTKLSNQQAFYVEISRAKFESIIYTDDKAKIERQLSTTTGEKQSALEQAIDPRAKNSEDIYRAQLGLKTSDEIKQQQQQSAEKKVLDYLQNLNPNKRKQLEVEYRQTQSKTILSLYDKSKNKHVKQNYQNQIKLYAKTHKLGKDTMQHDSQGTKQTQSKQQESNIKPLEISR